MLNKNELTKFEKWVINQKLWLTILLIIFTYFIWIFVYIYCKYREKCISNYKIKQKEKERTTIIEKQNKYMNKKYDKLVFNKKIKVSETSYPSRQKLLKTIDFIVNQGDTPNISVDINKHSIDIYYCDIDTEKEQIIGSFYDYVDKINEYQKSIDYIVKFNFEIKNESNDEYILYCEIKIYN